MVRLDRLMAQHEEQGNAQLAYLFAIYTLASSRLSRMLRDHRALSGEAALGKASALPAPSPKRSGAKRRHGRAGHRARS